MQFFSYCRYCLMQYLGKGMSCVYQQSDIMLLTERRHRFLIHRSLKRDAMMKCDILHVCLGRIIERLSSLFQHLYRFPSFCRSSEN